jgi:hypothetical protein
MGKAKGKRGSDLSDCREKLWGWSGAIRRLNLDASVLRKELFDDAYAQQQAHLGAPHVDSAGGERIQRIAGQALGGQLCVEEDPPAVVDFFIIRAESAQE